MNGTIKINVAKILPGSHQMVRANCYADALVNAIRAAMVNEHGGYYVLHPSSYGEGFLEDQNGFRWKTTAGNVLAVEIDELSVSTVTLTVSGHRHGIPWRFFGQACRFIGLDPMDLLEASAWEIDSQRDDLAPWLTEGDRRPNDWNWICRQGGEE